MFPQMSSRELLKTHSTRQTRHSMLGDALPPIDWCCWGLWCCNSNYAIGFFLGLQCEETAIGLLKRCMHVLWGEFLRMNLGKNKIFRHFEEALGHGIFLRMGHEETTITACAHNSIIQ